MLGIPDAMAGAMSPADTVPPARAAAEKAILLDPQLAEAYSSRGHVRWKERDWSGAEADFKRSIELNPNYAYVHLFYAIFLAYNGRMDEGIAESKRATELDPYSIPIVANHSYLHYVAHRTDEAIVIGKRAVAFDDSIPIGRQRLATRAPVLFHRLFRRQPGDGVAHRHQLVPRAAATERSASFSPGEISPLIRSSRRSR